MSETKEFKVFRETALPSEMEAFAIYLIAPPDKPDYVEMYVTDRTGGKARRALNERDIQTLIAQTLSAAGQMSVVANITERDRIREPKGEVYVIDASGDSTVKSGGARYLYHSSQWIKTAEAESMDLNLSWDALEGKPNSTANQIDNAVQKAHEHDNKTQLDKIGEDESGNLLYGGQAVKTKWSSTGW